MSAQLAPADGLSTWDDLLAAVPDGTALAVGGAGQSRKPVRALVEIACAGRRDLDVLTFVGGLDIEVLLAASAVRSVTSSSIGLGRAGRAPRFTRAVADEEVEDREMSEWMLLGGLRAAAGGTPFVATRAGIGSDLADARGLRSVVDPYTHERYLAIPPLRPDVAVIQVWRADHTGNVQVPWPPDHLWDVDVLLARAARRAFVCAEEVVSPAEIARDGYLTRLFSFEVSGVLHVPRGSWPTAFHPHYGEDDDWMQEHAPDPGRALLDAFGDRVAHSSTDREDR